MAGSRKSEVKTTGIPKLDLRIKLLKKFINDYPESKYINNGFYTNKNVYIEDDDLAEIPIEFKMLKIEGKKILNAKEVKSKFINGFKNRKYKTKKMTKQEFKKFLTSLKRFKFEQIRIINGKFKLYDVTGHSKWKMYGETEEFNDIVLDFNYPLLISIFEVVNELINIDVTLYTSGTYLVIKFISTKSVTIYARGVTLEDKSEVKLEQKSFI